MMVVSQDHRTVERRFASPNPCPRTTPRAGCPDPCPGLNVSKEEIHNLWVVCASAQPPAQHRSSSSCSEGTSCPPVCICCLLSQNQASLKRAWLHSLCSQVFYTLMRFPLSHLQAELPQPFFMGKLLQSLTHSCGSSLDSLQYCPYLLELGTWWARSELDTAF